MDSPEPAAMRLRFAAMLLYKPRLAITFSYPLFLGAFTHGGLTFGALSRLHVAVMSRHGSTSFLVHTIAGLTHGFWLGEVEYLEAQVTQGVETVVYA